MTDQIVTCPDCGTETTKEPTRRTQQGADEYYCESCETFFQRMGYDNDDWSAHVIAENFLLGIKINDTTMATRDHVAAALRATADLMQGGIELDGHVHDEDGEQVGWWAYENDVQPDPHRTDEHKRWSLRGALEVYADDEGEARDIARRMSDRVSGADLPAALTRAAPALRLPAIHGEDVDPDS